ncbi:MAG: NEW3 domain-containing protein [Planctomycetota bacterium]
MRGIGYRTAGAGRAGWAAALVMAFLCPSAFVPAAESGTDARYDFESDRDGNRIPDGWRKVKDRGLRVYPDTPTLDGTTPRGGQGCLGFVANSDDQDIESTPFPVESEAHYALEGWFRAEGFDAGGLSLSAVVYDAEGRILDVLPGPSIAGNGAWMFLRKDLAEISMKARYIGVRASLSGRPRAGRVWLDDVALTRVPVFRLKVIRVPPVFVLGETIGCRISWKKIPPGPATLVLTAYDSARRSCAIHERKVDSSRESHDEEILLSIGACGYFEVEAVLRRGESVITAPSRPVVVLSLPEAKVALADDVGVVLQSRRDPLRFSASDFLRHFPFAWMKVHFWPVDDPPGVAPDAEAAVGAFLDLANIRGVSIVGVMGPVPPALRPGLGEDAGFRGLLKRPPVAWDAWLKGTCARYPGVDFWQLGTDGEGLSTREEIQDVLRAVKQRVGRSGIPAAGVPFSGRIGAESGKDEVLPELDFISCRFSGDVEPKDIPARLGGMGVDPKRLWFAVDAPPLAGGGAMTPEEEKALSRFVRILLYGKAAGVRRIFAGPLLGREPPGLFQDEEMPTPAYAALATMARLLNGVRFRGSLVMLRRSPNLVFENDRETFVAVWNEAGVREDEGNFGTSAAAMDLMGNALPPLTASGEERQRLPVGPLPVFVRRLDPVTVALQLSFRIDPPTIRSEKRWQEREVMFRNPSTRETGGKLSLTGPAGWVIEPARFDFHLKPGEAFSETVRIAPPHTEVLGPHALSARFEITGDRPYRFNLLSEVTLDPIVSIGAEVRRDKGDVEVLQTLANRGGRTLILCAYVVVPGRDRMERPLRLRPGASVREHYRIPAASAAGISEVIAGAQEDNGEVFGNIRAVVPP